MKFSVQVHYSGVKSYTIEADSLDEAKSKAVDVFYEDGNEGNVYTAYGTEE